MTPETLYQPLNSIRTEYRLRMNRSADLAAEFAAEDDMQSVSEHSTESERCREAFQAMNRAIFAVDEYYAALSAQQREPVVREELDRFEARIEKYITQLNALGRADIAHLLRRDVDCLMAAIEIIPAGAGESSDGGVLDEQCGGGQTPYVPRRFDSGPSETHDGGPPEPSPLAVASSASDPASGRSQPLPDVSVDELARLIADAIGTCIDDDKSGVWINCHPAARALLARYRIGRR